MSAPLMTFFSCFIFLCKISMIYSTHWIINTLPLDIKRTSALGLGGTGDEEVERLCSSVIVAGVDSSVTARERDLCRAYPGVMVSLVYGAQLGLSECGKQFRFERWNCTFNSSNSGSQLNNLHEISQRSIRETAFLYSVWSAGVVYSVTNACSRGHLKECYCDPKRHGQDKDGVGDFTWGGCSDHIKFGMKVSRVFLDSYNRKIDESRIQMDIHNNRVGRRVVWKTRLKKCKCHGVSGACSLRTCWQRLTDFRNIGETLKRLYRRSQLVIFNRQQNGLVLERNHYRRPSRRRMVFLDRSPDFCSPDSAIGHPGTGGRECNFTSLEHDSCSSLCCNQGHHTYEMIVEENCECKFFWCCEVRCKVCRRKKFVYRCRHSIR